MHSFLINLNCGRWIETAGENCRTLSKGCVFLAEDMLDLAEFAANIESAIKNGKVRAELQRVNGFYSWISEHKNFLYAGVDHVRSVPLFYAKVNNNFYLSDDAEWIRQQLDETEMDVIAKEEFLLCGYVTGQDTLYKSIKQLQAGEFLEVYNEAGSLCVKTSRYYLFSHSEPLDYDEEELKNNLALATFNSMRRLVAYAAGAQIVVPLSGGYDSRLIVTMLKRLGYTNVLCFTYGVPRNKEAEYSRLIAKALDFEWVFVEYSAELWRHEWTSPDAHTYRQMAANHVSLPHVQDWLAIRALVVTNKITANAVIAPGHSGDFVAGSHIPEFVFYKKEHSEDNLIEALVKKHFSNAPSKGMSITLHDNLKKRLKSRLSVPFECTDVGLANSFEMWGWQERQAKYIVNSVRVYDQFELRWWLPQWDIEFVRFWEGVPLTLRKNREWFKKWIQHEYAAETLQGVQSAEINNASDTSYLHRVLLKLARSFPKFLTRPVKNIRRRRAYSNHFLAFEGLVDIEKMKQYVDEEYNIIGMYCDSYISNKW